MEIVRIIWKNPSCFSLKTSIFYMFITIPRA